jgi:hypothetical protein
MLGVVAVLHLATFPEESVGFVERENGTPVLGGIEEAAEVLLRLTGVLADQHLFRRP